MEAWPPIDAFRQGLRDLGHVEGQNVRLEHRYAEGRNERFRELAEDLVASNVDVILTWGTEAALEAKRATRTIPIVMGAIGEPIGPGVVSNLARPGGNITGFSAPTGELEGKRLELLAEVVPNLTRVAVIANPTNRYTRGALQHAQRGAQSSKIALRVHEAHDATTLDNALESVTRERPQALLVIADSIPLVSTSAARAICIEDAPTIRLRVSRACRSWRLDRIHAELFGSLSTRRWLRGQDPEGHQARRSSH